MRKNRRIASAGLGITLSYSALFGLLLWLLLFSTRTAIAAEPGLVFCNSLSSEESILNGEVGPGGTFGGGSFVSDSGLFGQDAYSATNTEDDLVTFPKEVIPSDRGTIEFWSRLVDFPANAGVAYTPRFVSIVELPIGGYEVQIQTNSGVGNGGLVSTIGNQQISSQPFGAVNYADLLGDPTDWHHYAASWDIDGVPGAVGTGTLEIWLDGVPVGNNFFGTNPMFPQPTSDVLKMIRNDLGGINSVQMSNLKTFDFAKIDFSDRFDECLDPEIPTVSEWGLIIMALLLLTASTAILLWRRRSAA